MRVIEALNQATLWVRNDIRNQTHHQTVAVEGDWRAARDRLEGWRGFWIVQVATETPEGQMTLKLESGSWHYELPAHELEGPFGSVVDAARHWMRRFDWFEDDPMFHLEGLRIKRIEAIGTGTVAGVGHLAIVMEDGTRLDIAADSSYGPGYANLRPKVTFE